MVYFFENHYWIWLANSYILLAQASGIDYWKAHKPVCFVLSYFLSITEQYEQRTVWKVSLQSIHPLQTVQKIPSRNVCFKSWNVKAIRPKYQQCWTHFITSKARNSMKSVSAIFTPCPKAITHLPQIVIYTQLWRKNVVTMGYEGSSSMMQYCSCCVWWKGTSQNEVILINIWFCSPSYSWVMVVWMH